jgi:hypothetical protein
MEGRGGGRKEGRKTELEVPESDIEARQREYKNENPGTQKSETPETPENPETRKHGNPEQEKIRKSGKGNTFAIAIRIGIKDGDPGIQSGQHGLPQPLPARKFLEQEPRCLLSGVDGHSGPLEEVRERGREGRREKGEERREKGEGRREKGEEKREGKGEERREKGKGRRETYCKGIRKYPW